MTCKNSYNSYNILFDHELVAMMETGTDTSLTPKTNQRNVSMLRFYKIMSCNSLISSCLAIRPLLLSLKSTCASLYFVITSTNFLARMACCGKRKERDNLINVI